MFDIQVYPLSHLYFQETKLDLLTPDECSYFEKMLAPNRTNEICTGRKNSFPKHWKFKRLLSKTKKKYHFKLIGPSTNYLGFKKTKYNFYLGGTDSCQGKVLSLLEAYFDLISSPSPSIKIQIMGRKNIENLAFECSSRMSKKNGSLSFHLQILHKNLYIFVFNHL